MEGVSVVLWDRGGRGSFFGLVASASDSIGKRFIESEEIAWLLSLLIISCEKANKELFASSAFDDVSGPNVFLLPLARVPRAASSCVDQNANIHADGTCFNQSHSFIPVIQATEI